MKYLSRLETPIRGTTMDSPYEFSSQFVIQIKHIISDLQNIKSTIDNVLSNKNNIWSTIKQISQANKINNISKFIEYSINANKINNISNFIEYSINQLELFLLHPKLEEVVIPCQCTKCETFGYDSFSRNLHDIVVNTDEVISELHHAKEQIDIWSKNISYRDNSTMSRGYINRFINFCCYFYYEVLTLPQDEDIFSIALICLQK